MKMLFVLLFLLLGACGEAKDTRRNSVANLTNVIEIQLSEVITKILSESPLEFRKECLSQVNMCWYKINKFAADANLPSVLVNKALKIESVTSVSMSIDGDVGANIENLDLIVRGLPDDSRHEEYQEFIYDLMDKIKAAGWRHYYYPTNSRISGSQIDKVVLPNKVLGDYVMSHPWLDPNYRLDLARWLKIGSFYTWYFFKDGNYLAIDAWRHDSDDAPGERGTYLISLSFRTELARWRSAFRKPEEKEKWKQLLPGKLKEYQAIRAERERKAIAAGIEIDTSYQDPPIRALEQ